MFALTSSDTVAFAGVLAGLLSTLATLGFSMWSKSKDTEAASAAEKRAAAERDWLARRDAYVDLYARLSSMDSAANGARANNIPHSVSVEEANAFLAASSAAELLAPPLVWAEMKPLVDVVAMKLNITSHAPADLKAEVIERLREMGAHTPEGFEQLRQRFIAAVQSDLALGASD